MSRGGAAHHEVLEDLGAEAAAVDEADARGLERRLAVLAPDAQLPVVLLRLLCAARQAVTGCGSTLAEQRRLCYWEGRARGEAAEEEGAGGEAAVAVEEAGAHRCPPRRRLP